MSTFRSRYILTHMRKVKFKEVLWFLRLRGWLRTQGTFGQHSFLLCLQNMPPRGQVVLFIFFFKIFFMWAIFKVFIKFVILFLLFSLLVFGPQGMWDLISMKRA